MMKYPALLTPIFVSIALILTSLQLNAAVSGDFSYSTDGHSVTINGYTGIGGNVTIPKVVNGLTVASIGDQAFNNFTNLTSIAIPDGVTSIGTAAFANCSNMTSATLPNTVVSIGDDAFELCTSLTNETLPSNVVSIGYLAFYGCGNLTSITIPDSVTSIGTGAFAKCNNIQSSNGFNYVIWKGKAMITGYAGNGTESMIPSVINNVPVTSIEGYAFYSSTNIVRVTIPASISTIGDSAFQECTIENVTIPNSITSLPESLFSGCSNLTNVAIPSSVTAIPNRAFQNCYNLQNLTIPDSVKSIGEDAFVNSGLTYLNIPNSVTSIGYRAFYNCINLVGVSIPSSISRLPDNIFENCSSLTSITIPNSVTEIGNWAFYNCNNLKNIWIPNSVTNIGIGAFYGCTSLTGASISSSVITIPELAFGFCSSLTNILIPNSVVSIGDTAFYGCSNLTNMTIPNSVSSLGDGAFAGCNNIQSSNGFNYVIWKGKAMITGYAGNGTESIIPSVINNVPVTSIDAYTFLRSTNLISLTIPNSVTSIGLKAFYESSVKNIILPNRIACLTNGVFGGCTNLTNVSIPSSVTSIASDAFGNCPNLKLTALSPSAYQMLLQAGVDSSQIIQSYTKQSQSISFPSIPAKSCNSIPFVLTGAASSGLPLSFSSSDPSVATVSSNVVTILGVGTTTITASQPGDYAYLAATPVSQILVINKGTNLITFVQPSARPFTNGGSFTLAATAPGGVVSLVSSDPNVLTVSGNTATILGSGTVTVTASQGGNANYYPATSVSRSVVINKATQVITFAQPPAQFYTNRGTISLSATAPGGVVSFESSDSNVLTISGNTATILGSGTATVTASQGGNTNYLPANNVSRNVVIKKAPQTITFTAPAAQTYGTSPFALSATAASGLPVTFTSANTNVATIAGNTVTIVGAGSTSITASQPGNANYNAAANVSKSLTVAKAAQTVTFNPTTPVSFVTNGTFSLSATSTSGGTVTFTSGTPSVLSISGNKATMKAKGTVNVTATAAATTNYNAASKTNSITLQ